jgi:hypothetical protein
MVESNLGSEPKWKLADIEEREKSLQLAMFCPPPNGDGNG